MDHNFWYPYLTIQSQILVEVVCYDRNDCGNKQQNQDLFECLLVVKVAKYSWLGDKVDILFYFDKMYQYLKNKNYSEHVDGKNGRLCKTKPPHE